jgi:uncharacterized membrane protein (DUF106 family)
MNSENSEKEKFKIMFAEFDHEKLERLQKLNSIHEKNPEQLRKENNDMLEWLHQKNREFFHELRRWVEN